MITKREVMKVGDRVVTKKKVILVNGKEYPKGTSGIITCNPFEDISVHVLFDGDSYPCGVAQRNLKIFKDHI